MAENGSTETPVQNETTEQEQTTNKEEEEVEYIIDPICNEDEMRKMFVGGISTDATDDELKDFFEQISGGKVTDNVIIKKESDKKSHFGFITFDSSQVVDEVLLIREQLKFKDRQLDVNRAVPKNNQNAGAHEKTKKLFIANLPKTNCSEDQLRAYFKVRHNPKYGTIESIQLIKKKDEHGNKTEENKGFGFVVVSSEDMADKMAIQHATFEFGGRKIELKKSVPNAEGGKFNKRGGRGGGGPQMYGGYGGGYGGYGGAYGGAGGWGGGYDQGFGGQGYGGYDYYGAAYGGGYGPQQGGAPGGRGRGGRYRPY